MKFIITQEVLEAVANYLAQRPFVEAAPLIQALQAVTPLPDQEAEAASVEAVAEEAKTVE